MRWNQAMRDDQADDRGYSDFAGGGTAVEAWVARGRMKEMQAKGWRALGPIREDAVWMRGPDPDMALEEEVWKPLTVPAAAAAAQRLRLRAAAAVALRRPHGRRVA